MNKEGITLRVNDKFQNYIKENFPGLKKYVFINELIFYGIFVYYYYFGPIDDSVQNFLIVKYIILIVGLRYLFNNLTNLTEEDNKITYFQINSKLAIFIVIILFLSKSELNINSNSTLLIILGYTLLTSSINTDTTTVNNILTTVLVLYIYSLNFLN